MKYKELGIYIHIPFCKSKCYYCDFISYVDKQDKIDNYIKKVLLEIDEYNYEKYNITTIYIGGGTPSYINCNHIKAILKKLKEKLKNNETKWENIEITIEINPGTINKEKLETYKKEGVNRISIGLQSSNDYLLKQIGRIHSFDEFLKAYKLVKQAGFENINVDIIIGLPNQTIKDVKETLNHLKNLAPSHISVYSLIIEEGTKIEKLINEGTLQLPDEDIERNMYWYVKNTLELNEYKHYEISNFAKKGKESRHNLNCWEQKEYIGLGAAAHSYLDGVRYSNEPFNKNGEWNFKNKTIEEKLTLEDSKKEYMMLSLRKIDGVSIQKFKEKYGENPIYLYHKELETLTNQGLIEVNGDSICLTNKGLDFANLVFEEFV